MTLEETDHYKYLGHIQTKNNSLDKQIKMVRGKIEAAYQKILSVAGSATFYEMEMETIWITIASNIIPIITYSGETWEPTKKETIEINRIMDNILKRVLKVPQSTPRECLYIETGIMDPQALIMKNRLNMHNRIMNGNNKTLKKLLESESTKSWATKNKKTCDLIGLPHQDLEEQRPSTKQTIKKLTEKHFKKESRMMEKRNRR